jgi:hypothetical protein
VTFAICQSLFGHSVRSQEEIVRQEESPRTLYEIGEPKGDGSVGSLAVSTKSPNSCKLSPGALLCERATHVFAMGPSLRQDSTLRRATRGSTHVDNSRPSKLEEK